MKISRYETDGGKIAVFEDDLIRTSSSSKGDQLKWNLSNLWLKADKYGYEGLAETVVSDILTFSNLSEEDICRYRLCEIRDSDNLVTYKGCVSENFIIGSQSLVTFYRLFMKRNMNISNELRRYSDIEDKFKHIVYLIGVITGYDVSKYIRKCLALDAFFLNEDRHTNNFALIIDKVSCKSAPLFDNGFSLLSYLPNYPLEGNTEDLIRKVQAKYVFSLDLKRQYKVLCKEPPFIINSDMFNEYIDVNRQDLGRVADILLYQRNEYPELFTDSKSIFSWVV